MLISWRLLRLWTVKRACWGRVGIGRLGSRLGLPWCIGVGLWYIWMKTASRLWGSRCWGWTRGSIVGWWTRRIKVRWLLLGGDRWTSTWTTNKVLSIITYRGTRYRVWAILWRWKLSLWRHTWVSAHHITPTTSTTHSHHVHSSSHTPHRVHGAMRGPTRSRASR